MKNKKAGHIDSPDISKNRISYTDVTITPHKLFETTPTITVSGGLVELENDFGEESLYRGSRGLMKTNAKQIGRETKEREQLSLMDIGDRQGNGDKYSAKVALFFDYLTAEWQEKALNKEGFLVISNLSAIAEELKTEPKHIKDYITKAGAYAYPYITKRGGKIVDSYIVPFEVKVVRYTDDKERVGEGFISPREHERLNKRYPFKEVWIKPHKIIRGEIGKDTNGRDIKDPKFKRQEVGLGNVFKSRKYLFAGLYLSDIGNKLLNFTGSNKPYFSISFDKLVKHLGYTEQYLKKQGSPRVKKWIEAGFKELQNIGHIERYSHNKKTDVFKWTCSNKYYKYYELVESKSNVKTGQKPIKKGQKYIPFNDKTVPLAKRKNAYKKWAKSKGTPQAKVENIIAKKFK
jgi:hypothetical protein